MARPMHVVSVHASRFQWHNSDLNYDILPTLRNLRLSYVREVGYINLRCVWSVGCPPDIRPFEGEEIEAVGESEVAKNPISGKGVYRKAFQELYLETRIPSLVAISCFSQFAVSRQTVQRHGKERYLHLRDWLLNTSLEESLNGRIFESSWHSKSSNVLTPSPTSLLACPY
ncbi:hypothetical protein GGS26DRAFT_577579 [Hypomontagnella submonticulosa]|nr:hypothetical protein GGS26DRAFT_577579 [Hypomontagnella submonticulosa]